MQSFRETGRDTHVKNALLNQLLERRDALLRDDRDGLGDVLEVEVLLEERVLRSGARRRLTHQRPVLGTDGLLLELSDLLGELALPLLVRRERDLVALILAVLEQIRLHPVHDAVHLLSLVLVLVLVLGLLESRSLLLLLSGVLVLALL
jgi:hypothetical protein